MAHSFFLSLRRHWLLLVVTIVLLLAAGWTVGNVWPFDRAGMLRSSCTIEGETLLYLRAGKDSLLLSRTATHRQGTWVNRYWWAPSCMGRLLTSEPAVPLFHRYSWPADGKELREGLSAAADSLQRVLRRRKIEAKELAYYLRTHGVQDEGYDRIARYATEQSHKTDTLAKLVAALKSIPGNARLQLYFIEHNTAVCRKADGTEMRVACEPRTWSCLPDRQTRRKELVSGTPVWLRTSDRTTPSGVRVVSLFPWTMLSNEREALTVALLPGDTLLVDSRLQHRRLSQPRMFAPDGAPVFTKHGYCLGVSVGKEVVR